MTVTLSPAANGKPQAAPLHPLDPLSESEITLAAQVLREDIQKTPSTRVWFKSIQLREPPKKELVPWLDAWHAGKAGEPLARKALAMVGARGPNGTTWMECTVAYSSDGSSATVEAKEPIPEGLHAAADMEEMIAAEKALLSHPEFKAAIEKLQLPAEAKIVADGWIYGADTIEPQRRYIPFMVYLSFSDDPDSCHYAAPLPIVPAIHADDFTLAKIEYCPIFGEGEKTLLDFEGRFPWEVYAPNEYVPELLAAQGTKMREDVKPYRVTQPEGTSFKLNGRVLEWQKWSLHIGFNYREGPVLSDVRYDGRRVFHRLSVSDMTVPYGDPRAPYHRKQAFDLGDVGAGICANELHLGCDCLGVIHYLDFDHWNAEGKATKLRGAVCLHEQDDGIGWKHTNFRTNRPFVTRSRVMIIQTIITVANYEYIFAWKLDQAGALHLETRATGILSTAGILPGEKSPYGNIVSPGVLATNHQHLFSLRCDPAIDGDENTVVQEDSVPMPFDKANPPANNRWGVGYTVEKTPITKAGFADAAPHKNRVFKIQNPNKLNPISGNPVGYKLVPSPSQLMLAHPDSVGFARAEFGDHHIYVTSYRDGELYAGGQYTNQSSGNARGLRSWYTREDNVANADLVLWHTFGLTHNPRVEDFPVMPCETHMVSFKPADFFDKNPAIDVPASTQGFNQSSLHEVGRHLQGSAEVEKEAKANGLNGDGASCCKK
ncbi:hypothetical protein IAT38_003059 [Cryptococcus sp. DSM 104549]